MVNLTGMQCNKYTKSDKSVQYYIPNSILSVLYSEIHKILTAYISGHMAQKIKNKSNRYLKYYTCLKSENSERKK